MNSNVGDANKERVQKEGERINGRTSLAWDGFNRKSMANGGRRERREGTGDLMREFGSYLDALATSSSPSRANNTHRNQLK